MDYSTLKSLLRTLEWIDSEQRQGFLVLIPRDVQQIASLKDKADCLLVILEQHSQQNRLAISHLEAQINDASFEADDIIGSHILTQLAVLHDRVSCGLLIRSCFRPVLQDVGVEIQGLEKIIGEFDSILEALSKIENREVGDVQPGISLSSAGSSRSIAMDKSTMVVGLDEDLLHLKHRLTGWPSKLDVISVVGMGGIGKTTLARNLYNDRLIEQHFDTRAWIAISQEYHVQAMLSDLLEQSTRHGDAELRQKSNDELAERLHKCLKGRRYLIVMDDVWDTKAWDEMRRYFPDDNNGSRIILTTRLSEVAIYANSESSTHHMSLLSFEASWNLLREKVFGEEDCPFELEEIGKEIARSCKGLPLAIVVVGGLLSKGSRTEDHWKYIARNTKSVVTGNDDQLMEILSLSYYSLPHHLKACFLYMGVYPEDFAISVSVLIKLWIAEGFIETATAKILEEVAEDYLNDLIDRSLIMVHQRNHNGGIKTIITHDLLRELCIKKAQDENFLHVMRQHIPVRLEGENTQRRVSIHPHGSYDLTNVDKSYVHSLLYFRWELSDNIFISFAMSCRLLRVLDTFTIWFYKLPSQIFELVHLRYLAFTYHGKKLSASICKLRNLQVLFVHRAVKSDPPLYLPSTIWEMPQLRHLLLDRSFLPHPKPAQIRGECSFRLENLQTLSGVVNFRCSKEIFEIMPNLKKLKIFYIYDACTKWSSYEFNNLMDLHKLETFKCCFIQKTGRAYRPLPINLAFPPNLMKLTLSGCRLSWEEMPTVGSLSNLEVLKLKSGAFIGSVWEPNEGEFAKLKVLLIDHSNLEHWRANETHFPCLQHLSLIQCNELVEVPSEIAEIPTLQLLELYSYSYSARASARLIREEQRSLENNNLRVIVRRYHQWV